MWGRRRSSRAKKRQAERAAALPTGFPPPNPFAPLAWPPPPVEALLVDPPPDTAPPPAEQALPGPDVSVAPPVPPSAEPEPRAPAAPPTVITVGAQAELLRLFEVVTNMCDHVIEYIESDRAERRLMLETLTTLGQTITDSAAALAPRLASAGEVVEARVIETPPEPRERVVGGSMPSGPEPVIDLRNSPAPGTPAPNAAPAGAPTDGPAPPSIPSASGGSLPVVETRAATTTTTTTVMTTQIAVEVRGRFGDRWVDGFEICEVMETPEGHRYRLRRHRDGVVLPELFDATSIRHVETFDQLATTNGAQRHAGNGASDAPEANVNDATGYAGPSVNGASTRWSRS
jgi:hypothetical protein